MSKTSAIDATSGEGLAQGNMPPNGIVAALDTETALSGAAAQTHMEVMEVDSATGSADAPKAPGIGAHTEHQLEPRLSLQSTYERLKSSVEGMKYIGLSHLALAANAPDTDSVACLIWMSVSELMSEVFGVGMDDFMQKTKAVTESSETISDLERKVKAHILPTLLDMSPKSKEFLVRAAKLGFIMEADIKTTGRQTVPQAERLVKFDWDILKEICKNSRSHSDGMDNTENSRGNKW
mmetsp:Transcript_14027/g.23418  ORF Transcript_14027/g.23418 Transcript_14027/m.23418 type:complete len:237 (+) Transcript_14027:109-819(+)